VDNDSDAKKIQTFEGLEVLSTVDDIFKHSNLCDNIHIVYILYVSWRAKWLWPPPLSKNLFCFALLCGLFYWCITKTP